jgi:hypothetical protein
VNTLSYLAQAPNNSTSPISAECCAFAKFYLCFSLTQLPPAAPPPESEIEISRDRNSSRGSEELQARVSRSESLAKQEKKEERAEATGWFAESLERSLAD